MEGTQPYFEAESLTIIVWELIPKCEQKSYSVTQFLTGNSAKDVYFFPIMS